MKQLTSYNRVAGYLNKLFDQLNQRFFENSLTRPTITIQSTPRAYGHFSLSPDTWISVTGSSHEINIGAGTLARPIECVTATLLHEMIHYDNYLRHIQDCSRSGTYHNKRFQTAAVSHGLHVEYNKKYGWAITTPNEALLDFILEHDLTDILINRNEYCGIVVPGSGAHSSGRMPTFPPKHTNSRKYRCPRCGNSVRATKEVHILCADCQQMMAEP